MKYTHILLTTAIAIALSGCGNKYQSDSFSLTQKEDSIAEAYAKNILKYKVILNSDGTWSPISSDESKKVFEQAKQEFKDRKQQEEIGLLEDAEIVAKIDLSRNYSNANPPLKPEDISNIMEFAKRQYLYSKQKKRLREEELCNSREDLQYIWGGTLYLKYPRYGSWESAPSFEGLISDQFKHTILKIWDSLSNKGFSGFDSKLLEAQKDHKFLIAPHPPLSTFESQINAPQHSSKFVENMLTDIMLGPRNSILHPAYIKSLKFVRYLLGLKYNNKPLILVHKSLSDVQAVLAEEFHQSTNPFFVPSQIDSDIPVTQAQIDEWNQVFIDALKEDPFFGKELSAPTDTFSGMSALSTLRIKSSVNTTQLTVNGAAGSLFDLGLPMYVQLKGSINQDKSTKGVSGLVAYKLGNSVLGIIQSYANSGTGFNADSLQLETSIVAAHAFGLMFVEGQFGSVSATDVNFKDWSGVRSQLRVGIDTPFGAPFVQLTHRDFGQTSDTAGYVGFEIANTEFKADTYAFSTSLLSKVGHQSVHGATGSIDWTAALNLNSGIAFNTQLTLGSTLESKAAFNLSIDR